MVQFFGKDTRRLLRKTIKPVRVTTHNKDYVYSNQLIEELFASSVIDHSDLYKRGYELQVSRD